MSTLKIPLTEKALDLHLYLSHPVKQVQYQRFDFPLTLQKITKTPNLLIDTIAIGFIDQKLLISPLQTNHTPPHNHHERHPITKNQKVVAHPLILAFFDF